jgi:hypothetical protein
MPEAALILDDITALDGLRAHYSGFLDLACHTVLAERVFEPLQGGSRLRRRCRRRGARKAAWRLAAIIGKDL